MDILRDEYFENDITLAIKESAPVAAPVITDVPLLDKKDDPDDKDKDDEDDISYFEAVAQEADKKNKNNRIYPKAVLESALGKIQPKIKRKEIFAMTDHPNWMEGPRISRIAAIVSEAALNSDNKVMIKGYFVDNDAAKEVKSLLKMGVKVGVSARGYGDYDLDEKTGVVTLKDGYEIEGWDFVVYPAANAKITHFESEDKTTTKDSKEDIEMDIRTLDGLRAAYPELVASLEKPLVDQVETVTADAEAKILTATEKVTVLDAEKVELQTKFDELNTRHEATLKALDEAAAKLQIVLDENNKMKSDVAATELKLAVDALLKDNKYAQFIKIDAALDTIEKVKAFVDAETAKFDAFAQTVTKPVVNDEVVIEQPKAKLEDMQPPAAAPDPIMNEYVALASTFEPEKL